MPATRAHRQQGHPVAQANEVVNQRGQGEPNQDEVVPIEAQVIMQA